jgi:hypothetical protein
MLVHVVGCIFQAVSYVSFTQPPILVLGLLWLLQISASSPFAKSTGSVNWTIPYLSASLGLNIIITLAIVVRLWIYRRRATQSLGPGYGSEFTSISAIMVESAALYSFFSLLFLASFAAQSSISTIFLQSLCQIQVS